MVLAHARCVAPYRDNNFIKHVDLAREVCHDHEVGGLAVCCSGFCERHLVRHVAIDACSVVGEQGQVWVSHNGGCGLTVAAH